jgi:hypothetical protein
MNYENIQKKFPDIARNLQKIKYLIYSMGGFDTDVKIDFDVDINNVNGEVYTLSIYVGESFEFDGLISDLSQILKETDEKMWKVFKRIKLDEKLNINRTYKNTFLGGMIGEIIFKGYDGVLTYETHYVIEI